MGVWVGTGTPHGARAEKLGPAGSQVMLSGYLFAAYAVAGRPDSKRVCAWVGPSYSWHTWRRTGAPIPVRNQPSTVRALISHSTDEDGDGIADSGYCFAQEKVIELGLKFKAVTDPMLDDLVILWDATRHGNTAIIDAATAARISEHMHTLIPLLQPSESWYETLKLVADVFHEAAKSSSEVTIG